jgi:hypothetical protein
MLDCPLCAGLDFDFYSDQNKKHKIRITSVKKKSFVFDSSYQGVGFLNKIVLH